MFPSYHTCKHFCSVGFYDPYFLSLSFPLSWLSPVSLGLAPSSLQPHSLNADFPQDLHSTLFLPWILSLSNFNICMPSNDSYVSPTPISLYPAHSYLYNPKQDLSLKLLSQSLTFKAFFLLPWLVCSSLQIWLTASQFPVLPSVHLPSIVAQ